MDSVINLGEENTTAVDEQLHVVDETLSEFWQLLIRGLITYGSPLVNLTGSLLNGLGMGTLINMGVTTTPVMFMFALLLTDWIAGVLAAIFETFSIFAVNLFSIGGRFGCKFLMWSFLTLAYWPHFILVLFTFDRVLAVTIPFRYRVLKKKPRCAVVSSFAALVLMGVLTSGTVVVFDINEEGECEAGPYISEQIAMIYFLFTSLLLFAALPTFLIFIFNAIIVHKLRKKALERRRKEKDLTILLLGTSFTFLTLTLFSLPPRYIGMFHMHPKGGVSSILFLRLSLFPATINRSINFIIYFTGGRMFRRGFANWLNKLFLGKRQTSNTVADKSGTSLEMTTRGNAQ